MPTVNNQPENLWTVTRYNRYTVNESDPSVVQMGLSFTDRQGDTVEILQYPDLDTTGDFSFDIQDLLEDQVSFNLPQLTSGRQESVNSFFRYTASFQSYQDASGCLTALGSAVNGAQKSVINSAIQQGESMANFTENAFNEIPYRVDSNIDDAKFLTNAPSEVSLCETDYYFLSVYSEYSGTTPFNGMYLRVSVDSTSEFISINSSEDDGTGTYYHIGVGVPQLNTSLDLSNGYSVQLWNNTLSGFRQRSESRSFNIVDCCSGVRIHWLNRIGGWDAYTFKGTNFERYNQTKETYTKQLPANFTSKDRGNTVISVDSNQIVSCFENNLTKEKAAWVSEILTSPEVYIVTDQYTPVIVQGGETTTDISNDLASIRLNLIKNQNITQRN